MILRLLALSIATLTTACVSSRSVSQSTNVHLPANAALRIQVPADGRYEDENYQGSGRTVALALKSALIRQFPNTEIGTDSNAYQIRPTILRWEERATEWSGKPDKVSISLQLYRPGGGLLSSAVVDGNSSWWTLGGDHPEDLLHEPFAEYAAGLSR
jgi:hypothetical protein